MVLTLEQGSRRPHRWVAMLLAFAVFLAAALPAVARGALGGPAHDGPQATSGVGEDCHPHAVPGDEEKPGPAGRHDHGPPGLACCIATHCSMMPAALPFGAALPIPMARDLAQRAALGRWPPGLAVRPALPPPRL